MLRECRAKVAPASRECRAPVASVSRSRRVSGAFPAHSAEKPLSRVNRLNLSSGQRRAKGEERW
jgi:hypothetical protein